MSADVVSIEDRLAEQLQCKIAGIADRLHGLANEIQRIAEREVPKDLHDLKPDYLRLAQNVIHEVNWGVANLGLSSLFSTATDVDRYARQGPS